MAEHHDDDASSRLTATGCLLTALSAAVILGSAVPIVSWRDPDSKLPLPRSVAIAVPFLIGALCFGIGSAILKVLGLTVWAKPKKDPSGETEYDGITDSNGPAASGPLDQDNKIKP
jgi:hypothetical protein